MANNSLIYSNAIAKTLENTLLSSEKITRMVFSENLDEALKILAESGYGGGFVGEGNDYDGILNAENEKICAFVTDSAPKGGGIETFMMSNDYHNAKALVKAKYMRLDDANFMLAPKGNIDIDYLTEQIKSDVYNNLPKKMADAISTIDADMANGNRSPRNIDIVLDRAMFEDVLAVSAKCKCKTINRYWQTNVDFANISTFVRTKRIEESLDFFKNSFIKGGRIGIETFASTFEQGLSALADKLKFSDYRRATEPVATDNMTALEVVWDNYILALFKDDKNDLFSIAPIAGLYVAKKIEIKVVRMILLLLKNNVDKVAIKQRLRDYYA